MIVFAGENNFASFRAARELANRQAQAMQSEVVVIAGDELSNLTPLREELSSIGLFGGGKIVLVKRLLTNKKITATLATQTDILTSANLILWEEQKLDQRQTLTKYLLEKNLVTDFALPKIYELGKWLLPFAKQEYQLTLSTHHAKLLVDRTAGNLWQIDNELKKIRAYLLAKPGVVTNELIETIVSNSAEKPIWDFLDQIGANSKGRLAKEWQNLMQQNTDLMYLNTMLQRELRLLATVKHSQESGERNDMKSFVLEKVNHKLANFNWQRLKRGYLNLLKLDTMMKNGECEPRPALFVYLLQL